MRISRTGKLLLLMAIFSLLLSSLSLSANPEAPKGENDKDAKKQKAVSVLLTDSLDHFPNGVTLDSNPDLESLLERADQFIKEKNHKEAIIIFRHLLSQSLSIPCRVHQDQSHDGKNPSQVYQPLSRILEDRISKTPELLNIYRTESDPELESRINELDSDKKVAGLKTAMQSHFLSRHGDDMAFYLMNLALDGQNFGVAKSLLDRLLSHPDIINNQSNLSPASIALRSYIIHKRLNMVSEMNVALALLKSSRAVSPRISANLDRETAKDHNPDISHTRLTNLSFKSLIASQKQADKNWWLNSWQRPFRTQASLSTVQRQSGNTQYVYPSRKELAEKWQKEGWLPVDQPHQQDGRLYFFATGLLEGSQQEKNPSPQHLICFNVETGEIEWQYKLPALKQYQYSSGRSTYLLVKGNEPYHPEEIAHFTNQLNHQIATHQEKIYFLCGKYQTYRTQARKSSNSMTIRGPLGLENFDNQLYSLNSDGTLNWQVSPTLPEFEDEKKEGDKEEKPQENIIPKGGIFRNNTTVQQSCFISKPAVDNHGVYVAISQGNNIYLQKRDPSDGGIIWNTFLCMSNQPVNSRKPVNVAMTDNELFVSSGLGLVYSVNKSDGGLNWVTRYKREANTQKDRYGRNTKYLKFNGWLSNYLYVCPDQIIVLPTDASRILYIDRLNGHIISQTDCGDNSIHPPCNISLGIIGNRLYTAGPKTIISHQWAKGTYSRMQMANLDDTESLLTGIPHVSEDFLLVPKNQTIEIYKHDAYSDTPGSEMELLNTLSVDTPGSEPVGNLFVFNGKIHTAGLGQLYAIEDSHNLIQKLEMVSSPTPAIHLQKSKIYRHLGKLDLATNSLTTSARMVKSLQTNSATISDSDRREIVTQLSRYSLDDLDKGNELLDLAFEVARTPIEKQTVLSQRLTLSMKLVDLNRAFSLLEGWIKDPPLYYTSEKNGETLEYHFDLKLGDVLKDNESIKVAFKKHILEKLQKAQSEDGASTATMQVSLEELQKQINATRKESREIANIQTMDKKKAARLKVEIVNINKQIAAIQGDLDQFDKLTDLQTQRQTIQRQIMTAEGELDLVNKKAEATSQKLAALTAKSAALKSKLPSATSHEDKLSLLLSILQAASVQTHDGDLAAFYMKTLDKLPPSQSFIHLDQLKRSGKMTDKRLSLILKMAESERTLPHAYAELLRTYRLTHGHQSGLEHETMALRFLKERLENVPLKRMTTFNRALKESWQFPLQGDNVYLLDGAFPGCAMNGDLVHQYADHQTIYVMSSNKHSLIHLDLNLGKPVWSVEITSSGLLHQSSRALLRGERGLAQPDHINVTPYFIIIDHTTHLEAIDRITGKSLWKKKYQSGDDTQSSTFVRRYQNHKKIAVNRNSIVTIGKYAPLNSQQDQSGQRTTNTVRMLRTNDGEIRWQRSYDKNTPTSVQIFNDFVIVKLNINQYQILDRESGKLRFQHRDIHSLNNLPFIPTEAGMVYVDYRNFKLRKWLSTQNQTLGPQIISRGGISAKALRLITPDTCMVVYQEYNSKSKQVLKARFVNISSRKMSPTFEVPGNHFIDTAYNPANHRLAFITKDRQDYIQAKVFDARDAKLLSFFNLKRTTPTAGLADQLVNMDRVAVGGQILEGRNQHQYKIGIFDVLDPSYYQGYGLEKQYFSDIKRISIHQEHMLVWTKQAIHAFKNMDPVTPKQYEIDGFWKEGATPHVEVSSDMKDVQRQLHIAEQKFHLYRQEAMELRRKSIKTSFEEVMEKVEKQSLEVLRLKKLLKESQARNNSASTPSTK